jgi:hypothetical protein
MKKKKPVKENKRLKTIGLSVLLIPALFFLLFLFGETVGGDISGVGHLFQIIPIIILGYLAFKLPFIGGLILTFVGTLLLVLYTTMTGLQFLVVDVLIFLPLIISGILLIFSQR